MVIPGGTFTLVTFVTVLFEELESGAIEATVTTFVISPPAEGVTVIAKLVQPPLAKVPALQRTLPPPISTAPGEPETKVALVGKASVTVTLEAEPGPGLVTVSW